jgi:predicted secreted protein
MNGSDILVLINTGTPAVPVYEVLGSQRDVTFDEATEEIDVSSKDSRAKRVLPGRYSSGLSLDALYVPTDAAYLSLRDAMRDGEMILVARQDDGVTTETADVVITSLSEAFPDQGEGTISISLTIDGFWTELVS